MRATEKSYLEGTCEVSRWDEENNEDVYDNFAMGTLTENI